MGFRCADGNGVEGEEKRSLGELDRIGRCYVGLGLDYLN